MLIVPCYYFDLIGAAHFSFFLLSFSLILFHNNLISRQVMQALDSLSLSYDTLQTGDYASSLAHSIRAVERAERAFFNPTMVSMLYFPDEHKYAIYMPLFVPTSMPLIMALVKEVREIRRKRKTEKEAAEKEKVE